MAANRIQEVNDWTPFRSSTKVTGIWFANIRDSFNCHRTIQPRSQHFHMIILEWVSALLLGAVLWAALARRLGAPSPALLALGGVALAFLPQGPRLSLDPSLALALFVAPVLL